MRFRIDRTILAGLLAVSLTAAVQAQDGADHLLSTDMLGFQALIDGAPSRSGFPPADTCPEIRKHVLGQPWNDWTRENLPEGCKDVVPPADSPPKNSHFEIRAYLDIGTVGWDNVYGSVIPSIGGFHVSFADLGGWKFGAGGLLASFSPVFDVQSNRRTYQLSPRINVFNLNKQVTSINTKYDLYFSVQATRELFLPYGAQVASDGSRQFNNVFAGVALSSKSR